MSNFKIGDRVICINDSDQHTLNHSVKKNNEYIITGISQVFDAVFIDVSDPHPAGYWSWRFRKLDTQFAEDVCAELIADAKRETILN